MQNRNDLPAPDLNHTDYKLTLYTAERRAVEYLAKEKQPTVGGFLEYLLQRREKPRRQ